MRSTPRSKRFAVLGAAAALSTAAVAVPALAQVTADPPNDARPDRAGEIAPVAHHVEMMAELEGLEGDALADALEELRAERQQDRSELRAERHSERQALRDERHAERQELPGERHAERQASRDERHADRDPADGRGPGAQLRADGQCPLASD